MLYIFFYDVKYQSNKKKGSFDIEWEKKSMYLRIQKDMFGLSMIEVYMGQPTLLLGYKPFFGLNVHSR